MSERRDDQTPTGPPGAASTAAAGEEALDAAGRQGGGRPDEPGRRDDEGGGLGRASGVLEAGRRTEDLLEGADGEDPAQADEGDRSTPPGRPGPGLPG